jgi:hypothetical protein
MTMDFVNETIPASSCEDLVDALAAAKAAMDEAKARYDALRAQLLDRYPTPSEVSSARFQVTVSDMVYTRIDRDLLLELTSPELVQQVTWERHLSYVKIRPRQ